MSEHQPVFDSPRDAALYEMAVNAWACESTGADRSLLGFTAWMSNSPAELPEIVDAFSEEFEQVGLTDPRQLIGHWLVDRTGDILIVTGFETEDEVQAAYGRIEALHSQLEGGV